MSRITEILKGNFGFDNIKAWTAYAEEHDFQSVGYRPINECPFCKSNDANPLDTFVYYSTLHSLVSCSHCDLIYTNVVIDPDVRAQHFQVAYKDPEYFENKRREIFKYISHLIREQVTPEAKILDIGGATGSFATILKSYLPQAQIVVNDLSEKACQVSQQLGFQTQQGSIYEIPQGATYDCITALDVLYYEERLQESVQAMHSLLSKNGLLVLRLPNKYNVITLSSLVTSKISRMRPPYTSTKIPFFNPEHLFVFKRSFLLKLLREHGFSKITFQPSPLLGSLNPVSKNYFKLSQYVSVTMNTVLTPSMIVVAKKGAD